VGWIAFLIGLLITVIGVLGMTASRILLVAWRFTETSLGLSIVAVIGIASGLVLILAAATSRAARALWILGGFIFAAGIMTPVFGIERARAIIDWWSAQGPSFVRNWSALMAALGLFVVYALTPRR